MLLTSGQVSLAISSTIVFFFTTALFLCGYVVQQKTVNDIREAIKPQPRPVHTNLYVPPSPNATPEAALSGEDAVQIVEITNKEQINQEPTEPVALQQEIGPDEEEGLIQGADGGFLRKQPQRRKKQNALLDDPLIADLRKSTAEGVEIPGKSAFASGSSTPTSSEKLSRAARRKLIKDEFVKLAGEESLSNPNTYKKRRLW